MQDPREVVVRTLFLLRRIENELGAQAEVVLAALAEEIAGLIGRIDPTGTQVPRYRRDRAAKLIAAIEARIGPAYADMLRDLRAGLAEVGRDQATRSFDQMRIVLGRSAAAERAPVSLNAVKAMIDSDPIQGTLLKDWFQDQAARTAFRVRQQINLGVVNGETVGEIVMRVRGKATTAIRDGGKIVGYHFAGGVMETSTREATAIVRTAVNHVANQTQRLLQEANADVAPQFRIVATLDSRTSAICQALDGQVYAVDDPSAPRPPFHLNCRTITVPVVDWAALGVKPPPEGERAAEGGPVPASTDYSEWLRSQPAATQNEILGADRAKLFRAGKVTLRDLVRTDGRRIPLSQLSAA